MSRVYFRRTPKLSERFEALLAPRPIRGAIAVAQKISFKPSMDDKVRLRAVEILRRDTEHYAGIMHEFKSSEALAVLAFMDTLRELISELETQIRATPKSYSLRSTLFLREVHQYRSTLAVCALYMRRSGYMDKKTLGKRLFRAAEHIETMYPSAADSPATPVLH